MWRWIDPLEELRRMQEKMERFLSEMERRKGLLSGELIDFPVDVIDEDEIIRVVAELPGFNKGDIEITVENGYLVIRAERKEEEKEVGRGYLKQERKYGELKRRVSLPAEIKLDGTKASYNNGILEVTLPKAEVTKKKKIDIE